MTAEVAGLPGVTLDPKDEADLEAQFGVTSNAEELVRQNRARYSPEHREALKKGINIGLTGTLYTGDPVLKVHPDTGHVAWEADAVRELKPEIEEAVGAEVVDAVVRGDGRKAAISYVYKGPRGSLEKASIPYVEVFGSAQQRKESRAARATPESILQEAEGKVAEELRDAREEASRLVQDAKNEAQKLLTEAEEEVQKLRDKAAEQAVATAEESGDGEASAKQTAARSGRSKGTKTSNK